MKRRKLAMTALSLVMAFVLIFTPTTAFAAQQNLAQQIPSNIIFTPEDLEEIADIFGEIVALIFGVTPRTATLNPEARDIALEDFDYLVDIIMQTAPTINILSRRIGMGAEDFFGFWRQMIYNEIPLPSLTGMFVDERWEDAPEDSLYMAADYLFSLLLLLQFDVGGLGHFGPVPLSILEDMFFGAAHAVHLGLDIDQDAVDYLITEYGMTMEEIEDIIRPSQRFTQINYNTFNTPSVLWFYGIDPTEFDFTLELDEVIGTMDPYNIVTEIIEPGRIAYFSIASFINNIVLDSETLFPFYEQIQDYEHLIIDIRGNGGGWPDSFTSNVVSMFINENISFTYPEFFVANPLSADFFEYPLSMAGGFLYGIFPAGEFVQSQNMTQFDQDDLELLDYAILWHIEYAPAVDNIPFDGEIWLLVDGGSASASEMAARLSIATGFATVVGEPTAGVTGVIPKHVALPSTGVLFRIDLGYTVDQYGRSFEEFGVIPQIANMPEMDALETVLMLIDSARAVLNIDVALDGIYTRGAGVIVDDRTFVSIAALEGIFANLQIDVQNWHVGIRYNGTFMTIAVDAIYADVNGNLMIIPVPAQIINGEIFLPIRFIAENLGYDVDFDNGVVILTSNQ